MPDKLTFCEFNPVDSNGLYICRHRYNIAKVLVDVPKTTSRWLKENHDKFVAWTDKYMPDSWRASEGADHAS